MGNTNYSHMTMFESSKIAIKKPAYSTVKHFRLRAVISVVLATLIAFGGLTLNGSAANLDAGRNTVEVNSENVVFNVAYPEIGKEMTVLVTDREEETYLYKWYINGEQIGHTASSYTPVDDDLEKMISVKVYDTSAELVGTRSVFLSKLPVVYIEVDNRATPRVKGQDRL